MAIFEWARGKLHEGLAERTGLLNRGDFNLFPADWMPIEGGELLKFHQNRVVFIYEKVIIPRNINWWDKINFVCIDNEEANSDCYRLYRS